MNNNGKEKTMSEENMECPVDLTRDDPTRYKRMLDVVREAGGAHAWTTEVHTGELSCWILGSSVIFVQRIGDSVEVYTNTATPNTWDEIEEWLKTL
jgi:hypothetical protein